MTHQIKDDFLCGVMAALGQIYECGQETIAEELVKATGAVDLLRVARANDDIYLPNLRKTARELKRLDRLL